MQYIFIFLISVFLFTTNCDQKYAYLGTTKGTYTTTIWIQEDVGGECSYTDLDEIVLDTGSMVHHVENSFSGDSTATRRFLKTNFGLVPTNEIKRDVNGSFSSGNEFAFSAPPDDTALRSKFYAHFYSAEEWNRDMGDSGLIMPITSKGRLKKLYADNRKPCKSVCLFSNTIFPFLKTR